MEFKKTIGVLTPLLDGFYFGNILNSISQKAREYDAKVVMIGTTANSNAKLYASEYVDGWIVIMNAVDDHYIEKLRKFGRPIVGINTLLNVDSIVSMNNKKMMDTVVEHLVGHGHRRIGYVGDTFYYDAIERYDGYVKALSKHGITYQPDWYYDLLRINTYDIAKTMVEKGLPCSAIVTVNDLTAIELINHFKEFNVKIPEDISVIGFDDMPDARLLDPSLSTVHFPVKETGIQATAILMDLMNGVEVSAKSFEIKAYPVFRNSCGCDSNETTITIVESETIQHLSNMVARNFNLGQLMQSSSIKEITEMTWLNHTPFRRGFVGLWDQRIDDKLSLYRFKVGHDYRENEKKELDNVEPPNFPPYESLHDCQFMQDENVITIIPIAQDKLEIGVLALVGLGDSLNHSFAFNTTFQLGNLFASALIRESLNKEVESYSHQLEIISNITNDGIWNADTETNKVTWRGGMHKVLGYQPEQIPEAISELVQWIHPEDAATVNESFRQHIEHKTPFETECRLRHAEGHYIWMQIAGQVQFNGYGKISRVLGSIKDISERRRTAEHIRQLAYQDTLTGLANRLFFEEELAASFKKSARHHSKLALLLFDLDRFKMINDSYGHQAGDRLLQFVARKVRSITKKNQLAARLGGDEFVIVMRDVESADEALEFGKKIVDCLKDPFYYEEREYHISCSIGISIFPDISSDAETILKHADIAMYIAKSKGGNRTQLYTSNIKDYQSGLLNMENHLRKALEKNELELHYQPHYDMSTDRISGIEVLLRWNSAEFGLVMPEDFMPLAEENGLIIPIGEWVLREACLLNRRLQEKGFPSLKIFVNISIRELIHSDFIKRIRKILEETGMDPPDLYLDIKEGIMIKDIDYSLKILHELNQLGVLISMDDFGVGYSSMNLLKQRPIQIIKINKSFISDMTTKPESIAVVEAIIQMAHIMSIEIVAKGVETKDQLECLRSLNSDYVQGYYISKPLNYELLVPFIKGNK